MATNAMWRSKLGNVFPRAEVEKLDSEHHRILKKLRSQPGNDRCAECGAQDTTWSSVNLGVFLCVRCADVHRALGTHISKVKGCGGTYLWGTDEIAQMQSLGNRAWASEGSPVDSSTSKEELLRICRRKYENKPLPQTPKTLAVNTMTSHTSAQVSSFRSAARDSHAEAKSLDSDYPSQKSISDEPNDLDSFLADCLKPSKSASQALSQTAGPSSFPPSDPAWCLDEHSEKTSCTQDFQLVGQSSCQPSNLDSCFAPAPPSQSVVCRSLSGFDFDSFFEECSQPKASCEAKNEAKVLSVSGAAKHEEPVSQQRDAFEDSHKVPMPVPSEQAIPQSSLTGFPGMKFDSDAFFNDLLGGDGCQRSAISFKTSSVIW